MKQAAKKNFKNYMHHHDTMKTIVKSLLKQSRVFCTVYHFLPELRLRRIFLAVYFVDTNPPEERVKILLCGKELNELPVYSQNIFKKSYIDRYMERPSATFCNGKDCNWTIFVTQNFSILHT